MTRFTASGTHQGTLRGVPPTGKRIVMAEMGIFRIAGGKIVEKWGSLDRLGMCQQLGMNPTIEPRTEFLYDISMELEEPQEVGATPGGNRRILYVKGGTFAGPRLKGEVLPGGGDWTLGQSNGTGALDVRITLRTHDGPLIYAHYQGILHASPEVRQRLRQGDNVDPAEYYFRVAPFFETASEEYGWLNRIVAVGIRTRTPRGVGYRVYAVL